MACLDTCFLIDLFRGDERAAQRMLELEDSSESMTVAAPSIMEFATGVYLAESAREREALEKFMSAASVLPLDGESALLAGRVNAQLIKAGESIGDLNILIGAISVTHGERLITRNIDHFRRIPDLALEGYAEHQ